MMVVGFLFSPTFDEVILIRKTHPSWQANKLNGIGGHVLEDETPVEAMVREFHKEAGLVLPAEVWKEYAVLTGDPVDDDGRPLEGNSQKWTLHVFCGSHARYLEAGSRTEELITAHHTGLLGDSKHYVQGVSWLIPLALDAMTSKKSYRVTATTVIDAGSKGC
jgi:8-oxo-dGTP pyrophosphatase MutT (NUDIX family)